MKKIKNIISFMIILSVLGVIIGSFYDLQINKTLFYRENIFPIFFKIFGEVPMIILMMISSLNIWKNKDKINKSFLILSIVLFFAFPIVSSVGIQSYFDFHNIFISILIFSIYVIITFLINNKIKNKDTTLVIKYCIFIIISLFSVFLIFTLMKNIWGRMRFYPMYLENNYESFTNWWIINGKPASENFRSFPSGHTSAAASTFVLIFIPHVFKIKNEGLIRFFTIFPVIWTILVGISRILDGAHFLTDISMATLISISMIYYLFKAFEKNIDNKNGILYKN